jgi:sigma-B regulation protein RsbU (phosphoserine phosphatase)
VEIKRLLKQKRLSCIIIPIGKFPELRQQSHLIGTVIIDAEDLDTVEHQKVGRMIQVLEAENIGVIVLTHRVETRVRSFSLMPTNTSFTLSNTTESISVDDLWVQIGVNLAYRKRSSGITSKPMVPANNIIRIGANSLAEQLQMTASLVENLTEQLKLAGQVQRDFLPSTLPHTDTLTWAATFLPAEWVSGDIYDITRLDDDHMSFYILDAVGHAMPAALLTIFVKQAMVVKEIRDNKQIILSPAEVMRRLNIRMSREKLSGYQFATCCYCLLNTKTMELTYARAGHPYPLLIRKGHMPEQLEVRGALLGVFEQSEYVEETLSLQPGDKIILYSDGAEPFIGNVNEQSQFVFHEPFCKLIQFPITNMLDRFTTLTKNVSIDPVSVDDVTMVGVEVMDATNDL